MTQTTRNDTVVMDTIREIMDNNGAGKVFGDPICQDDLTVVPVAKVGGGGGGGGGSSPQGAHEAGGGTGGGLGVAAKPLGVFVIKDGNVSWRPALDLNKVIMGGQIVAVVALLTIKAIVRIRAKRK